ncbi:MAG: methylmalonyl Co-A mutase-associated GTPase MeaB [Cohaesibacteraceae bacterium]|nr:methylmalonyl Co-A mutase-associated GTPase MeaB [Cohaesibacteraceae bacterium]MBL4877155.1 methylmalonyl Co-A mutase-associated GTPase MeaB [Cohaesibacteraceae bacterium]
MGKKTGIRPAYKTPELLGAAVLDGQRAALARAITLIESRNPEHRKSARILLEQILPHTGNAIRLGITGVPGVGKSTTIDTFGRQLTSTGLKVAVLAVDPSSTRTGGSILGDKTRMEFLSRDPRAFIRPSPSAGTLGGVTARTRETMLLCEAAGYDVIIVETVGIGQSETAVANMVDFFLVLMLPGAGDELQGIKKGILEIADLIAVNKADGDGTSRATAAAADYRSALHILTPKSTTWAPPVMTISGMHNEGLDDLWQEICSFRDQMQASGEWYDNRKIQQVSWMQQLLEERLVGLVRDHPSIGFLVSELENKVRAGKIPASLAVDQIMMNLPNFGAS